MIIAIVGPTGVGKTKLSVELAKELNAEIINCDSMQIYKGLDIATAKVKEEEKEGIPHHLFDIRDVNEDYSVYDYQKDARNKIDEVLSRGKNVILVGGTGLYLKACLYDYKFQDEDKIYDFSKLSDDEVYEEALKIDSNLEIHKNNRRRLERFLTKAKNGDIRRGKDHPLYPFTIIGLTTDRENLYKRIDDRVEKMINEGLVKEAKDMYDKRIDSKALKTAIGYKELFPYFDGKISLENTIEQIKKTSRHYAKRQYTFFKNQLPVKWFETNYQDFDKTIEEVISYIKDVE